MKLENVIKPLQLEVLTNGPLDRDVTDIYIGDLLSVVMSSAKKDQIWFTVQTHINVIAIASLLDLAAVIIVENQEIDSKTIEKANLENMVVLRTSLQAYELAKAFQDYL